MRIHEVEDVSMKSKMIKKDLSNFSYNQKALEKMFPLNDKGEQAREPRKNLKLLGTGVTAYAVAKKDKPHEVKRLTFYSSGPNTDPYLQFLKQVIAHQSNPYFPRIYTVKLFTTQDARHMYYIEMEKLFPFERLNWAQWSSIFRKSFGKSIREVEKNDKIVDKFDVANVFVTILQRYLRGEKDRIPPIMDEHFRQALDILEDVYLKFSRGGNRVSFDLHEWNVMYRLTSYGAQPVITDPFV